MKIILSPSKKQNMAMKNSDRDVTVFYLDLSRRLFSQLKSLSKNDIHNTFKIKGNLLEGVYDLYQSFDSKNKGLEAISCYSGVVFEQIHLDEYNREQLTYLNEHLTVLSAMYGVLEPKTIIWPYRLDMKVKLNQINLYNYWQEVVDEYFKREDYIINLASKEFSKMIKTNKHKLITLHFLERQNDNSLKVISYNAKKARGTMAHLLIINQTQDIEEVKSYVVDGYKFDDETSDVGNYSFIR
ncbi:MAG: YaaA family protein [Tenericutes bacterium]|nr:YaaA family protein [Mycoplasmatota bacterium]